MSRVLSVWRPKSTAFFVDSGAEMGAATGQERRQLVPAEQVQLLRELWFQQELYLWSVVRDGNGGFLASGAVVDFDPILVEPEFNFVVAVLGFGGSFRMLISTFCHGSNCQ